MEIYGKTLVIVRRIIIKKCGDTEKSIKARKKKEVMKKKITVKKSTVPKISKQQNKKVSPGGLELTTR